MSPFGLSSVGGGGSLVDYTAQILRDYDFTVEPTAGEWTDRISGSTMPTPACGVSIPFSGVANTYIKPYFFNPATWGAAVGSNSFWFSFSFWAASDCATNAVLFNGSSNGSDGFQCLLTGDNKILVVGLLSAGSIFILSSATIVREQWNRVVVQIDRANNKIKLYLNDNAVQEATLTGSGTISMGSVTSFKIGGGDGATVSFKGRMGGWQLGIGVLSLTNISRVLNGREIDSGVEATWSYPNLNQYGQYSTNLFITNYFSDDAVIVDGVGCTVEDLGSYVSDVVRRFRVTISAGNSLPAGFYGMKVKGSVHGMLTVVTYYRISSTSNAYVGAGTSASAKIISAGNGGGGFAADGQDVYAGIYYAGDGSAADADFAISNITRYGEYVVNQSGTIIDLLAVATQESTDFLGVREWLYPGTATVELSLSGSEEVGAGVTLPADEGWGIAFHGYQDSLLSDDTTYLTLGTSSIADCVTLGHSSGVMFAKYLTTNGSRIVTFPRSGVTGGSGVDEGTCVVYDADYDVLRVYRNGASIDTTISESLGTMDTLTGIPVILGSADSGSPNTINVNAKALRVYRGTIPAIVAKGISKWV